MNSRIGISEMKTFVALLVVLAACALNANRIKNSKWTAFKVK